MTSNREAVENLFSNIMDTLSEPMTDKERERAKEYIRYLVENDLTAEGFEPIDIVTEYGAQEVRDDPTPNPIQATWEAMNNRAEGK